MKRILVIVLDGVSVAAGRRFPSQASEKVVLTLRETSVYVEDSHKLAIDALIAAYNPEKPQRRSAGLRRGLRGFLEQPDLPK